MKLFKKPSVKVEPPTMPQSASVYQPPFDPRSVKHFVISGHDAVKCFEWITRWEQGRDRAAQCRFWHFVADKFPETRGGVWALSMTAVDLIVHEPPNMEQRMSPRLQQEHAHPVSSKEG